MTGVHFEIESFSHGTLECRDLEVTKRFYREFLGLHCVRMSKRVCWVWLGGEWLIACIGAGAFKQPQEKQNRFALRLESSQAVEAAYAAAVAAAEEWQLAAVEAVEGPEEFRSFLLNDMDGNWWEIYSRAGTRYDDIFDHEQAPADEDRPAMIQFIKACSIDDLKTGTITRVEIEGKILAVYNIDGNYYATDAMCTHDEVDLAAEGELQGDIVECPAHFGQFHVPTGRPMARPCLIPLKTYNVCIEGYDLLIDIG
ncbi:Rieske 2Fe-2S domain-containing protein [Roseiarcaceae bacterium H3SJ34-1]|uniref:Rieske 2Fe-2S domain-containing protein n=1 Tax=Terripilifer ovatus TaxID=3032367 RepID=UPI003AB9A9A4|nr:Rieske 2Fe-2S domain-containing protein [Roseiarcaceae bacterium H3SJ34-1]